MDVITRQLLRGESLLDMVVLVWSYLNFAALGAGSTHHVNGASLISVPRADLGVLVLWNMACGF